MSREIFTFKVADISRILNNRDLEAETNAEERYLVLPRAFCSEYHPFCATMTKSTRHEDPSVLMVSIWLCIDVSGPTEPRPLPSKRRDTRLHFPWHEWVQDALRLPTDRRSVVEMFKFRNPLR
jgi:hypothetical protein